MRPRSLEEYVGQQHVLGPGKPLRHAIESGQLHSLILWGPPGTGKTTLARLIANKANAEFIALSAVMAGVKDIRAAVETARAVRGATGRPTLPSIGRPPAPGGCYGRAVTTRLTPRRHGVSTAI